MSKITPIVCFISLLACQKPQKMEKEPFATTDPSELFFQNVRSIYYHREIMSLNKVHIYRLKDSPQEAYFWPTIVYNWKEDRAYIMLNTQENLPLDFLLFFTEKTDTVHFTGENMLHHRHVCEQIARAISQNIEVYFTNHEQEKINVFQDSNHKKSFITVFKDFERLVE